MVKFVLKVIWALDEDHRCWERRIIIIIITIVAIVIIILTIYCEGNLGSGRGIPLVGKKNDGGGGGGHQA